MRSRFATLIILPCSVRLTRTATTCGPAGWATILDALTDHPDVWSKTAFFSTFDENDGFFDHVVPPNVPPSGAQGLSNVDTTNEIFPGSSEYAPGPYGMGIRVPMIVVSPWSKGGWVNSQVFDHSSLIRFIDVASAPNIPASWTATSQNGVARFRAT
jgi:phospholipase C